MQHTIPFPIIDYRPAVFGQHRAAGLGFSRAPSGALQSIVATAAVVLDVGQRRTQLRVALLEPIELGLHSRQIA
jgi:hypothetical protein